MLLTEAQVIEKLRARAMQTTGGQRALALKLGVSEQYLSDVLAMRRKPGKAITTALRLRRVRMYEPEARRMAEKNHEGA